MPLIRDLGGDDEAWVRDVHLAHYAEAEGFDASFAAAVDAALAACRHGRAIGEGHAWIAEAEGARSGCLFLGWDEPRTARLRLFYVVPARRGTGLGARLLATALAFAATRDAGRVVVSTFASHAAAGRLYARTGFRLTAARDVRSFGRDLVEQHWEIDPRLARCPCNDDFAAVNPGNVPP